MNTNVHPLFEQIIMPFVSPPLAREIEQNGPKASGDANGEMARDANRAAMAASVPCPTASPNLAAAAASTRTAADVILARFTPLPRWDVWALPRLEQPFHVEQTMTQLTNEKAALDCLKDVADNFDVVVIFTDTDGKQHNVSERFARELAVEMARAGWDAEAIQRYRFLGTHFCDFELEELCRGNR